MPDEESIIIPDKTLDNVANEVEWVPPELTKYEDTLILNLGDTVNIDLSSYVSEEYKLKYPESWANTKIEIDESVFTHGIYIEKQSTYTNKLFIRGILQENIYISRVYVYFSYITYSSKYTAVQFALTIKTNNTNVYGWLWEYGNSRKFLHVENVPVLILTTGIPLNIDLIKTNYIKAIGDYDIYNNLYINKIGSLPDGINWKHTSIYGIPLQKTSSAKRVEYKLYYKNSTGIYVEDSSLFIEFEVSGNEIYKTVNGFTCAVNPTVWCYCDKVFTLYFNNYIATDDWGRTYVVYTPTLEDDIPVEKSSILRKQGSLTFKPLETGDYTLSFYVRRVYDYNPFTTIDFTVHVVEPGS